MGNTTTPGQQAEGPPELRGDPEQPDQVPDDRKVEGGQRRGVHVVSELHVEIEAVCEVHQGSGRLLIRREGDRVVLNAHAEECCMITLDE